MKDIHPSKKIIINASNIHTGGGKVMLLDFLNAAVKIKSIYFILYIDPRFDYEPFKADHIEFHVTRISRRFFIDFTIKKQAEPDDLIIYFGNLPPLFKHDNKVILLLSNRYLIENYPLKGFSFKGKIRITIERMQFKLFHNNTDRIIVQSLVMKDLLLEMGVSKNTAKVLPFKNAESLSVEAVEKIENSFLYVASGEHHKNHINLIDAWTILAEENIRPTLFLTIDKSMPVYHKTIKYLKSHNLNIIFLENIPREELLIYYKKVSALIYPSLFESYGLPLLEAKNYGLPILASELDYVRDLLDPEQSFDPLSPRSISRAVKRFLNINERSYNVMTGDAFIKEISAWI